MTDPGSAPRVLVHVSPAAAVVEVQDRLYLRLDASGRWTAFSEGGLSVRRGVDGRLLRSRAGAWEGLDEPATAALDAWVVRRSAELLELIAEAPADRLVVRGDVRELTRRLRRSACGEAPSPAEERARFEAAYPEPVPILPPHRYRDLVLLPATGCPNHRCTFCAFYRDRRFRILDEPEFAAHLRAVQDLFGPTLAERDGIFLGSASALSIPDAVLLERLRAVRRVFGAPRRGVAAFHDPDRGPARDAEAWARLVEAGLREAALGLETGLPSLRRAVGKRDDLEHVRRVVVAQVEAGLALSLCVLVGLGGPEGEARHREATVRFVGTLPLTRRDRVYLSPLGGARADLVGPDAMARWRADLGAAGPARVGAYRIDRFAWLS